MMVMFVAGEVTALGAFEADVDTLATRMIVWVALACGAAACMFPMLAEQYWRYALARRAAKGGSLAADRPWAFSVEGVVLAVVLGAVATAVAVAIVFP